MSKKHYIFSKSWHRDYVFFLSVHLTLSRVLAPSPVEKSVVTRAVAQREVVGTVVKQVGGTVQKQLWCSGGWQVELWSEG